MKLWNDVREKVRREGRRVVKPLISGSRDKSTEWEDWIAIWEMEGCKDVKWNDDKDRVTVSFIQLLALAMPLPLKPRDKR